MAASSRSDALTPEELERALGAGPPAAIYFVAGEEGVLRDRVTAALRARLIAPGFEAFNYRNLSPGGLDAAALADEMRNLPMGGGRRLVVISPADSLTKEQLKGLAEYAGDPSPSTCLVIAAFDPKETVRKAFDGATKIDVSSPWEDKVPAYLEAEAKRLGVTLTRDAGLLLASMCGRDLSRAVAELRKAAGSAGAKGRVDAALVGLLAGGGEAGDVFKVTSALTRGDAAGAASAARRYLETEERGELRVLYECAGHLRRLLQARALVESGTPAREAAKAVRVFWKDADAFAAALPRWSEERIAAAFRRLLAADRSIKRGADDGAGVIESYLWETLRPAGGTTAPSQRERTSARG
ncbi:MAG: DNA polymerase III subunit delta [Acidobacteria bacterium]|nr:DNA polymerase III subunit delta [Acidobacteriota bacterium]